MVPNQCPYARKRARGAMRFVGLNRQFPPAQRPFPAIRRQPPPARLRTPWRFKSSHPHSRFSALAKSLTDPRSDGSLRACVVARAIRIRVVEDACARREMESPARAIDDELPARRLNATVEYPGG
jgi:hypothetical protein